VRRSLTTLYPSGLGSASRRLMYSGLDVTAHRQQSWTTQNWSWLVSTDTTGDNIDDTLVLVQDWSLDCSRTLFVHDDSELMHSSWCNVSVSVTTHNRTTQSVSLATSQSISHSDWSWSSTAFLHSAADATYHWL